MAEIKIEKKKTNWLPLLLGLLALLLVGWFAAEAFEEDYEIDAEVDAAREVSIVEDDSDVNSAYYNNPEMTTNDKTDVAGWEEDDRYTERDFSDYDKEYAVFLSRINSENLEMNVEHDYCHENLHALANSISALAKNYDLEQEISLSEKTQKIRYYADEITENWKDTDHADMIRKAAQVSVDAIEALQQRRFPNLSSAVESLRASSKSIDPNTLTLDQKNSVKNFFEETASVLKQMRS